MNIDTKTTPLNAFTMRQVRLVNLMKEAGVHALALNPGPSLVYLTGLHFHLMERPTVVIFTATGAPVMILPELETAKLTGLTFPIKPFTYGDNPATWSEAFKQATQAAEIDGTVVGVEPNRLRVLELRFLEGAAPRARFESVGNLVAALRIQKDESEIAAMQKAVDIAQQAFLATLGSIKAGQSEREVASELTLQLLRHGSQPEMPFSPIVSTGPNGANPHASPSDRKLAPGDLLVIDWGAAYNGYISDLTRTVAIDPIEAEYERIAQLTIAANVAGRAAARPGIAAGEVDRAARRVIENGGYGQYFIHRTGHGIGMEGHEDPYMFAENELILQPGMAFTVEPGIYLPGRGGVRIEDNLVITSEGAITLSDLARDLYRV